MEPSHATAPPVLPVSGYCHALPSKYCTKMDPPATQAVVDKMTTTRNWTAVVRFGTVLFMRVVARNSVIADGISVHVNAASARATYSTVCPSAAPPPPAGVAHALSPRRNVVDDGVPLAPSLAIGTVPDVRLAALSCDRSVSAFSH